MEGFFLNQGGQGKYPLILQMKISLANVECMFKLN